MSQPLLRLARGADGTEWVWSGTAETSDPLACEVRDAAASAAHDGEPAVELSFSRRLGRYVRARRAIRRGELLMAAPAGCGLPWTVMDDDAQFCSAILQRVPGAEEALGLNAPLLALALLASPHPILSSLSTHRERLGPAELALLTRVAELSGIAPDDLLACAANAFVITDEATATRRVAHGLFPAAAMLSHSCVPAAAICFADGGHTLLVRAISDIPKGGEVSVSYLAEEQLYAPWAERRALLRDGHHFEAEEPAARAAAERVSMGAPLATERWRTASGAAPTPATLAALERKFRAAAEAALRADAGGDDRSKRAAVETLRSLLHDEIERALHPTHWIAQEACAALVALGRSLDDPGLLSRYSLQLLMVREETLALGTPHLASLYATHASASFRLVREGRVPPRKRDELCCQAAAAFDAARRIRTICFGATHPLTEATARASAAASEAEGLEGSASRSMTGLDLRC